MKDRFCGFLQTVLDVTCQVFEITVFEDVGGHAEEILSYLTSAFEVEPTSAIQSVNYYLCNFSLARSLCYYFAFDINWYSINV